MCERTSRSVAKTHWKAPASEGGRYIGVFRTRINVAIAG